MARASGNPDTNSLNLTRKHQPYLVNLFTEDAMSPSHALAIFLGCGIGGILRVFFSIWTPTLGSSGFPWATLFANLMGALLLGLMAGLGFYPTSTHRTAWVFVSVGVCGGLTTFSTMQLELFDLLKTARYGLAVEYFLASSIMGPIAIALGYRVGTFFPAV
jgi:CrcB protein